jgi:hypothetical protein
LYISESWVSTSFEILAAHPCTCTKHFHLFGPSKEALEGKRFSTNNELFCNDGWTSNKKTYFEIGLETAQSMVMVYRGARRIGRKIGITF